MKSMCFSLLAGAIGAILTPPIPASVAAPREERVLHSFGGGPDGAEPEAGLTDVNGALYGTTEGGGTGSCRGGCGTVFSIDPNTGAEKVLYSFCSRQNCADGQSPVAGLIDAKGTLYGTTIFGGAYVYGTAFALNPKTGAEKVLHSFGSGGDGFSPFAGLIDVKGTLYGTTQNGFGGSGGVYALDPGSGAETLLYAFCRQQNCTDGAEPVAGLIDKEATLYGTTPVGGISDQGTVFALDPATGTEKVIYSFCIPMRHCENGRIPSAGLTDVEGTLYGTTQFGGGHDHGMMFALDPRTGAETVLYRFCSLRNCTDGAEPVAGLIAVNGTFYGTTLYGGDKGCSQEHGQPGCGAVFALDPKTRVETVLYSFCRRQNCTDGKLPQGSLINMNGTLYGTTQSGGAYGRGTVFAIKEP